MTQIIERTPIIRNYWIVCVTTLLSVAASSCGHGRSQPTAQPQGTDAYISANGVRLHYVDWGGRGEVVLFLTGLGDSAHRFDAFASRLTGRFRVLGLTRRGQAQSDKPPAGYDTATLTQDLKDFLDALHITRANFVGHSIAGDEMTLFAALHPAYVAKLVYMDAAYDRLLSHELALKAKLPEPTFPTASIAALERGSRQAHPDYSKVRAPALGFFVIYDSPPVTADMDPETRHGIEDFYNDYGKKYTEDQIQLFREQLAGAEVVELHDANHYIYLDQKYRSTVLQETLAFLSER